MAKLLKAVLQAFSGWEGYAALFVAGVVLGGAIAGPAAWHWQANSYERKLSALGEQHARGELQVAHLALDQLQSASALIHQRAVEYAGIQSTLGLQLEAIRQDLKNAKPLPADCRPDDFRVRKLTDAVGAAQQAAAAR
ncbi:hypothetical protein D9M68_124180 [compost metagenome]